MNYLKPLSGNGLIYDHIIGTGGIGSGIFFSMDGNHTLGRNESRIAKLLPYKDYCKQHIIMHYIAVLLGAGEGQFQSFPIGKVGNDDIGKDLLRQMQEVGINTESVTALKSYPTLFSVCFQYPDSSGGNITTDGSASSNVSATDISNFFENNRFRGKRGIILAAPEVPVSTRIKLLEYGRQRECLNVGSILSSEVDDFKQQKGFELLDLLSLNIDEARSIAAIVDERVPTNTIIDCCISTLLSMNPDISVLITDGGNGSYCYSNHLLVFAPAYNVPVASTAGAGDAYLAGTIAGICCGLPLSKRMDISSFPEQALESAMELGALLASLSVTSYDSIHPRANASSLHKFAEENKITLGENFQKLFSGCRSEEG
jgi:sugar/nucleoside kinase (ribokinase family)